MWLIVLYILFSIVNSNHTTGFIYSVVESNPNNIMNDTVFFSILLFIWKAVSILLASKGISLSRSR